jgi:2-oxoglutarate dehydrogenase E2 component (dihydrolipoamide succinyltransferase)
MSSIEIKIPTVGESISEVTIATWAKKDGDYVERDELLCELESDKATFELNAENSGILKIKVQEGETIEIGTLIAVIEEGKKEGKSESKESKTEDKKSESSGKAETIEMSVPPVGESISEVTISSWLKNTGDRVELDEVLCEIESDKATFELTAEASGVLTVLAKEGDTVSIGDPICKIEVKEGGSTSSSKSSSESSSSSSKSDGGNYAEGHASPAAAKMVE